jgi:hypothetical protein
MMITLIMTSKIYLLFGEQKFKKKMESPEVLEEENGRERRNDGTSQVGP